jgi:GNAT superfamily N-acetyltransferase
MESRKNDSSIIIREAKSESIYDFYLCAEEFIDLIDQLKEKFLSKKLFVLTAYYDNILAGIIMAEDKSQKVDALEKIVPTTCMHLLFVNSRFRNKHIGKELLKAFVDAHRSKGVASIYIKIPQKYKNGIKFLQKNNFGQINKIKSKIILEIKLWNDFGVRDCQIIGDNGNDLFS